MKVEPCSATTLTTQSIVKKILIAIILQLLLYLVGSNLATCLSQQILRSEGTTWLTVLPGITEIFLLECTRTDYIVQNSVDDASCTAARAARIT